MSRFKIAVACYRFIGDTLLATPFLKQLRALYPHAEIHLLVGATEQEMMAACPYIDAAIIFDPRRNGWRKSIQQLHSQSYQRVYLIKRSFSSALLMWLGDIPERIGFDTEHRGFLLTQRIAYEPEKHHEAICFLQLLQPKNLPSRDELILENWFSSYLTPEIKALLPLSPRLKIVLHATSTNSSKCWPLERFTQLAKILIQNHNAQIIFLGPAEEAQAYQPLITALGPNEQTHLTGLWRQTTLPQSIALLSQVDLVIANDCGVTHMAAAAGIPIVALFGPSRPEQWHPLARQVQVVDGHGAMDNISVDMVLDACKTVLTS